MAVSNQPVPPPRAEPHERALTPNPRLVSRRLMTRAEFQPATTLNVLAATWLQFMIRDWFSHGHGSTGTCGPYPSPQTTTGRARP